MTTIICKDCGGEAVLYLYSGISPMTYESVGYVFCRQCWAGRRSS